MFGFKIHAEINRERVGSAGVHEPPGTEGHRDSATTSPVSVMSPEMRGFPRFSARSMSSLSTATAPADKGMPPAALVSNASEQLSTFATSLKSNDLASMQKKDNNVYADKDGHSYVVIKDKVYRIWQKNSEPDQAYVLNPGTGELIDMVLERGQNDAWQVRQTQGLSEAGRNQASVAAQLETENQTLANKIYLEVKDAYRAGHKSDNKVYVRGAKVAASRQRASDASRALMVIRDTYLDNILNGKVVPPSDELYIPAGNCGELARTVAKRTIEQGGYAEVWKFDDADHAFTVIGHPPDATTKSFSNWKDTWIVDPWANLVCPATQYIDKFIEKMKKWERAGKFIHTDAVWPLDRTWMEQIIDGEKKRMEAPSKSTPNPWQALPGNANSDE